MNRLFDKLFFRNRLRKRGMYVVEYGERAGCFFVYVSEENILTSKAFLSMPIPLEALYLSDNDVRSHFKHGGLKFVSILPEPVYEVCLANFRVVSKKVAPK